MKPIQEKLTNEEHNRRLVHKLNEQNVELKKENKRLKEAQSKAENLPISGVSISSTNSELGSYHWFHTILTRHKHMGEFLKEKTPDEETLRTWGKKLYETSQELIDGYERINRN